VYFAPVSGTGVGAWTATTSYPTTIEVQSCAASLDGYIYCVGGYTGSVYTNAVYFASLHSSGVSVWTQTTNYPVSLYGQSCAVSAGYIYCVAGYTGSAYTNAVYFAPVSGTGVGAWTATTSYPLSLNVLSCVLSTGSIFCVGGVVGGTQYSAVYSAPYTNSGVGAWTATTSYPTNIGYESCLLTGVTSSVIYCVGGYNGSVLNSVYFASASRSGVGTWTSTTHNYPTTIGSESCIARRSTIFCVGGLTQSSGISAAVYYTLVS